MPARERTLAPIVDHRPSTIDLRTSPATIPAGLEFLLLGRLGALTRPTQLCGELS